MQNTIGNTNGTSNYFSGSEVYFTKGKGSNNSGRENILLVAKKGSTAGLDAEIRDKTHERVALEVRKTELLFKNLGIQFQINALTAELATYHTLGGTCNTWYRPTQNIFTPAFLYPAATLLDSSMMVGGRTYPTCVPHGIADCPGLYPDLGPRLILAGGGWPWITPGYLGGIVYQEYIGAACQISSNEAYTQSLELEIRLLREILAINEILLNFLQSQLATNAAELSELEALMIRVTG